MYNPLSNYYADFWPFLRESGLHLPATARKRPFSRARRDILPMHHRESGHVSALVHLCLAAVSVPINEIDALQLGAGLNLLVNPADVGSPGAFECACLCLVKHAFRKLEIIKHSLPVPLHPLQFKAGSEGPVPIHFLTKRCMFGRPFGRPDRPPTPWLAPAGPRPLARVCVFAPAGLLAPLSPPARAPVPACSDFFDFPQICAMRLREAVFFWLKEGRQGDLRQRNAIDAGRPANVQR